MKNLMIILFILIVASSGFVYSIYIKKHYEKIVTGMVSDGYKQVDEINTVIDSISTGNDVTLEELKETKKKLDAILKEADEKKRTELSLKEALKIIGRTK